MRLTLRRTVIAVQYCDNDYIVRDADPGINVGRIMLTSYPGGARWAWYLQAPHPFEQGIEDSLDEAKAAFRKAWERRKPEMLAADKLVELKRWQETEDKRHERRQCS